MTRAVGRFFGHIWGAASKPIPESNPEASHEHKSRKQVISTRVEEADGELGEKKVVLRRTTIEEVEIRGEEGNGQ